MRILYVEDNEVNQALVERVLRAKQCSVVFREEGEGALEVLADDADIDLILLDIELAGTMSGLDVIRTMRARNDTRPVVAITAYAMMGDRERFLEAGCDQYLPKPLVITDLLNLLDQYELQFATKAAGATDQPTAQTVPAAPAPEAATKAASETTSETTSTTASKTAAPETAPAAAAEPASATATPETATPETPAEAAAETTTEAATSSATDKSGDAGADGARADAPPDGSPAAPDMPAQAHTEAAPATSSSMSAAESANPAASKDGGA